MKHILFFIFGAMLFGGLFLVLKPQKQVQNQTTVPIVKTFDILIKGKKIASGSDTLKVTEGDDVVFRITNDENEELHLHGYDISVDLEKDKPAELSFTATITGRFSYELEKSKTDIGALEVSPK